MELYTLDGQLRRTELVEAYESFIWAERYRDVGDLNIVLPSTQQNRNLLAQGTLLGLSESDRIMRVETIEDKESEDGSQKLYITCAEFNKILKDRVAQTGIPGINPGTWAATGKPSDIVRFLFDYVCRDGLSDPTDAFPLLVEGTLYDPGNLPEDEGIYTIEREYGPLFDAMYEILKVWDLGMRVYKGPDDGTLYFDVYKGNDRTSTQTILPAVIFSPDLDSLQNVSELNSVANAKNVAYVYNDIMTVIAYQDGASSTTFGISKRVLFVDGTSLGYLERDYDLSVEQEDAINRALRLEATTDAQKTALNKLLNKERFDAGEAAIAASVNANTEPSLSSTEKTNLTAAVSAADAATSTGYTLTSGQDAAVEKALTLSSLTEQQRVVMKKIHDRLLIDATEATMGTSVTNNIQVALLATEQAQITSAISVSTAYEPGEWDELEARLLQYGAEELAKNRSISAFDGEITQLSPYKYRRDYYLGDLVEIRNDAGLTSQMFVTEQIFSSDESGEKAYPTLTINLFVTPGSWLAWENTQVWQDAPGTWSEA